MSEKSYITVDLDYPDIIQIIKTYSFLNDVSDNVEFRRSSNKGLHFRALVENMSFQERLVLREIAGDDRNRIVMDFVRNNINEEMATEVFWDKKNDRSAGEWYSSYRDLDMIIESMAEENFAEIIRRRMDVYYITRFSPLHVMSSSGDGKR